MKTLLAAISSSAAALMMAATALCTEPPTPAMGDLALGAVAQTPPTTNWEITYSQVGTYLIEGPGLTYGPYPWDINDSSDVRTWQAADSPDGWLHMKSEGEVTASLRWVGRAEDCPAEASFLVESHSEVYGPTANLTADVSNGFTWDTFDSSRNHSGTYLVRVKITDGQGQLSYTVKAEGNCGPYVSMTVGHVLRAYPDSRRLQLLLNHSGAWVKGPQLTGQDGDGNEYPYYERVPSTKSYASQYAYVQDMDLGIKFNKAPGQPGVETVFRTQASGTGIPPTQGDKARLSGDGDVMEKTLPWWFVIRFLNTVWVDMEFDRPYTWREEPFFVYAESRESAPVEFTYVWADGVKARARVNLQLHPEIDEMESRLYHTSLEVPEPVSVSSGHQEPRRHGGWTYCPFDLPGSPEYQPVQGGRGDVIVGPVSYDYRGTVNSIVGVASAGASLSWAPAGVVGAFLSLTISLAPPPQNDLRWFKPGEGEWQKSLSYSLAGVDRLVPDGVVAGSLADNQLRRALAWKVKLRPLYDWHYSVTDVWDIDGYAGYELNVAHIPTKTFDERYRFVFMDNPLED